MNLRQRERINVLYPMVLALRQRETHPVCLACSAESATEAISLALSSTERVFHIALKLLDIQYIREGDLQRRQ